jgi:hypothetical protein
MDKLFIIVRHGDYGSEEDAPLSKTGRDQMGSLRKVIDVVIEEIYGKELMPQRLLLSFSRLPRAIQSIEKLSLSQYEDVVITNLHLTKRSEIREPQKIVKKVLALINHYGAEIAIIVAHGEMPSVIAEAAHELVTGEKIGELPYPSNAHGFIVNMTTGSIFKINPKLLKERQAENDKKETPLVQVVEKNPGSALDKDIPF